MSELIIPSVSNETDRLELVVLGLPDSLGKEPTLAETYDAKSYESVALSIYPKEESVITEMNALHEALVRNGVEVWRPEPVEDYNQIFARDISFVIDDSLFVSNLIPDREKETGALWRILERIDAQHIETLPEKVHTEGGDILLYDDYLFVGCYLREDYPSFKMARTNQYAVDFFKERFPHKTIVPIELIKHDRDPRKGVLHLDCAFQPVGVGKALVYFDGFLNERDRAVVTDIFGATNLFEVTAEEAYLMNTNVVSVAPDRLISDKAFVRLNTHLRENWGIAVDEVPYREISKMGGLLRCSTMPLVRRKL